MSIAQELLLPLETTDKKNHQLFFLLPKNCFHVVMIFDGSFDFSRCFGSSLHYAVYQGNEEFVKWVKMIIEWMMTLVILWWCRCTVHADAYDFRMILSMVADDGVDGGGGSGGGGDAIQKHDYATITIWDTPSGWSCPRGPTSTPSLARATLPCTWWQLLPQLKSLRCESSPRVSQELSCTIF